MTHFKTASAALVSLGLIAQAAQAAAPLCTTQDELSALRTAALQQQLMVAGLTCQASGAYNRFVLANRPELQKSDAELMAYFIRRGGERGEANYDAFKTKLANLAELSDIADVRAYCANARVSFEMAMRDTQGLAHYVASQQLVVTLPEQRLCVADRQVMGGSNTSPAAGVNEEMPQNSAPPQLGSGPVQVAGVPAYNLPASPYRGSNEMMALAPPPPAASAPVAYMPQTNPYYADEDAPPPPPPPPPPRQRYGAPAWPPGWGQYPYPPRWYGYSY